MVEKGVRFVCAVSGGGAADTEWDAHSDIESNHIKMAGMTDKPVAGLIKDLKPRGMLDSTIVLWGGEFGRSPESEKTKGRAHHNTASSTSPPPAPFHRPPLPLPPHPPPL